MKARAVPAFTAKAVPQGNALGQTELGRGKADEKPAHKVPGGLGMFPGLPLFLRLHFGGGVQRIVQALPVAGTVAAIFRSLHVHIGKVGGDGGSLPLGWRQRLFG